MSNYANKPFPRKNYGSIGHLPESRLGPGDHSMNGGQVKILTVKTRDKHDTVIVEEKLDGSNVGIVRAGGELHAVSRSGRLCSGSTLEQHQMFARWVRENFYLFDFIEEGERLVGEWLAQAHGTRYALTHGPFVAFDLMRGDDRSLRTEFDARLHPDIPKAKRLHTGGALPVSDAIELLGVYGHHGALDPAEGVVYRVERLGKVDFLAKYVRADKVDGKYFGGEGQEPLYWNWRFQ